MLPTSLKIQYDGKKVRVKTEIESLKESISPDQLKQYLVNFNRFLLEVYLENPQEHLDYILSLIQSLIGKIDSSSGIRDAYVLIEPENVATGMFLHIGSRKITLALKRSITDIASITEIVNRISKLPRPQRGIVIKTRDNESLRIFDEIIQRWENISNLRELYFDKNTVKYLNYILTRFDNIEVIRVISPGNKCVISVNYYPSVSVDVRGAERISGERLTSYLDHVVSMKKSFHAIYLELSKNEIAVNKLLRETLSLQSENYLELQIRDEDNKVHFLIRHDSAIFNAKIYQEILENIDDHLSGLLEIAQKVLTRNISLEITFKENVILFRIFPMESEKAISWETDWINVIKKDLEKFLETKGD